MVQSLAELPKDVRQGDNISVLGEVIFLTDGKTPALQDCR
jgi:hypothetical protein